MGSGRDGEGRRGQVCRRCALSLGAFASLGQRLAVESLPDPHSLAPPSASCGPLHNAGLCLSLSVPEALHSPGQWGGWHPSLPSLPLLAQEFPLQI